MKHPAARILFQLLLVAACSNEADEHPIVPLPDGLVELNVELSLPVVGTGNDTVMCVWAKGDTVGIFDGKAFRPFIADAAGKTARFAGRAADTSYFFAVFPYRKDLKALDELSVPDIQRSGGGMPDKKNLLFMGGFRSTLPKCSMNLQYALLRLDVPSGSRTVLIRGNGGEAVCGSVMDGRVGTTLRLIPSEGDEIAPGPQYIRLRAGVFKQGLSCVMTASDEASASCLCGTSSVTVNRGGIYDARTAISSAAYESYTIPVLDSGTDLSAVNLTLNKESGIYEKSEEIELKASSTVSGKVLLKVLDGGFLSYVDVLSLTAQPKVVYKAAFDGKRSIGFMAFTPGQKFYAGVGALVSPEEYTPGYEMPSDFVDWWDAQKGKMRAMEPIVTLTPAAVSGSDASRFDCWALQISMHEGNPVRGYLAMPKGAAAASLPIYMYFHSAGVNKTGNRASVSNVISMAKAGDGCIALDMNAHGMPDDQPQSYYDALNSGELKNYSTRALTTRDEFYFRLMYLREVRALDYLCSRPEWDGKRVLVYGESQGGGQAAAICGLDSRVGAAVLNVPAMTDWGGSLQGRQSGWSKSYQNVASTALGKQVLPYFDGALMLQLSRAKLWMLAGHIDDTCHPACVWAAFNAAASTDKKMTSLPFRRHAMQGTVASKKYFNSVIAPERDRFINEYLL